MNRFLNPKSRKELEQKIVNVFGEKMQPLSKEFQTLLADDLVTAFEDRFKALINAQTQTGFYVEAQQKSYA